MSAYPQQADPTKAKLLNLKTGTAAIINRSATTVGRCPENDIITSVDFAVSRQHALILNVRDNFYVEDMGSRNGTYLNGKPLSGRMLLKHGDLIGLGMTVLMFQAPATSLKVVLQSQTQDLPISPSVEQLAVSQVRNLRQIAPQ